MNNPYKSKLSSCFSKNIIQSLNSITGSKVDPSPTILSKAISETDAQSTFHLYELRKEFNCLFYLEQRDHNGVQFYVAKDTLVDFLDLMICQFYNIYQIVPLVHQEPWRLTI